MAGIRKLFAVAVFFVFCECLCSAQPAIPYKTEYDSLQHLFSRMVQSKNDAEKEDLCDAAAEKLETLLRDSASFDQPFDSLKNMGKIFSTDRKIRFYTWNLLFWDGTSRYYGFIQYRSEENKPPLVYRLIDKSDSIEDPANAILDHGNWYGSLIYEIVNQEYNGIMYYILLGYDPDNMFISKKIIDVMYFNTISEPVFGYPMFQYDDRLYSRVIFQYSAKLQMSLQWIPSMNIIAFDHLSPEKPYYEGNYQFYGPDFSYDGFAFEGGIWHLKKDVDIRNKPD